MRVLVTGASGFLGSAVCDALLARGDEAVGLSRDPERARQGNPTVTWHAWNPTAERPPASALEGVDGVVNLIGEPIDQRWTDDGEAAHPRQPRAGDQEPGRRDQRRRAAPEDAGQPVGRRLLRRPRRRARRRVDRTGIHVRRRGLRRLGGGRARGREARGPRRRHPHRAGARSRARPAQAAPPSVQARASAGRSRAARQYMPWIHVDDEVRLLLWALDTDRASGHLQRDRAEPGHEPASSRRRSDASWAAPRSSRCRSSPSRLRFGGELGEVVAGGQRAVPRRAARRRLRVPPPGARAGAPGPPAALRRSGHAKRGWRTRAGRR